jgi:hypothetical protein
MSKEVVATIQQVKEAIRDGYGKRAIGRLEAEIVRHPDHYSEQALELQRWFILAQALHESERESVTTTTLRTNLVAAVDELGRAASRETLLQLHTIFDDVLKHPDIAPHPTITQLLGLLLSEVHIRAEIKRAEEALHRADETAGADRLEALGQADAAYRSAASTLHALQPDNDQPAAAYIHALNANLPAFHDVMIWLKVEFARLQQRQQKISNLEIVTQQAMALLEAAMTASRSAWPPELHELLQQVDPMQHQQFAYLCQIDQFIQRQQYRAALIDAEKLHTIFKLWPPADLVFDLCISVTLEHIKDTAITARYPEDIAAVIALLTFVKSKKPQLFQAPAEWVTSLEHKHQRQQELRGRLGTPPDPFAAIFDTTCDAALRAALNEELELFGRSEQDQFSVNTLLIERQKARDIERLRSSQKPHQTTPYDKKSTAIVLYDKERNLATTTKRQTDVLAEQDDALHSNPVGLLLRSKLFWESAMSIVALGCMLLIIPVFQHLAHRLHFVVLLWGAYPVIALLLWSLWQLIHGKARWHFGKTDLLWIVTGVIYGLIINILAFGITQIAVLRDPTIAGPLDPLLLFDTITPLVMALAGLLMGFAVSVKPVKV